MRDTQDKWAQCMTSHSLEDWLHRAINSLKFISNTEAHKITKTSYWLITLASTCLAFLGEETKPQDTQLKKQSASLISHFVFSGKGQMQKHHRSLVLGYQHILLVTRKFENRSWAKIRTRVLALFSGRQAYSWYMNLSQFLTVRRFWISHLALS